MAESGRAGTGILRSLRLWPVPLPRQHIPVPLNSRPRQPRQEPAFARHPAGSWASSARQLGDQSIYAAARCEDPPTRPERGPWPRRPAVRRQGAWQRSKPSTRPRDLSLPCLPQLPSADARLRCSLTCSDTLPVRPGRPCPGHLPLRTSVAPRSVRQSLLAAPQDSVRRDVPPPPDTSTIC